MTVNRINSSKVIILAIESSSFSAAQVDDTIDGGLSSVSAELRALNVDIFVVITGGSRQVVEADARVADGLIPGDRLELIVGMENADHRIFNISEDSVMDDIAREICPGELMSE